MMMKGDYYSSAGLLCRVAAMVLVASGGISVLASDVNWGKKVSCFVVDGTVVCPGCNYRAGLSCPRRLKNSQNCLATTTTPPPKTYTTTPPPDEEYSTTTEEETMQLSKNLTLPPEETNEIQKESTKVPIDMAIYMYRLIGSKLPDSVNRYRRVIQQEEEELEVCHWNGDCPCPLICCKTGPGCPKRCVMGIRLPPPWG